MTAAFADPMDAQPGNMIFADDDSRWQAVRSRDAVADGFFVYAVKTTKVYCRPICKARLARRANVSFYATGQAAAAAGFRACKRCKPDHGVLMPEERAVRQIRAFVRDTTNRSERLSLREMAARTGLSKWHFHRVFKRCVGVTPAEFLRAPPPPQQQQQAAWEDGEGGVGWPLGDEGLYDQGFDLGDLDGLRFGTAVSSEAVSTAGEATTASGGSASPLWLDDLLAWPEEEP